MTNRTHIMAQSTRNFMMLMFGLYTYIFICKFLSLETTCRDNKNYNYLMKTGVHSNPEQLQCI